MGIKVALFACLLGASFCFIQGIPTYWTCDQCINFGHKVCGQASSFDKEITMTDCCTYLTDDDKCISKGDTYCSQKLGTIPRRYCPQNKICGETFKYLKP